MLGRLDDVVNKLAGKDDDVSMEMLGDIDDSMQLTKDMQKLKKELSDEDLEALDRAKLFGPDSYSDSAD